MRSRFSSTTDLHAAYAFGPGPSKDQALKILQLYNQYRSLFNGEEIVVFDTVDLLESHGHDVELLMRTSRGIEGSFRNKACAFFSGIYNRAAKREMVKRLAADPVDVVHAHNLYPLFSPSVLAACKQLKTPVLMSLHNQNLTCPTADHLRDGKICELCTTTGREIHCVLNNCRGNLIESVGYSLRIAVARRKRLFHDNVTLFIALTEFAKRRLVANGFRESQIRVLPNTVPDVGSPTDASQGQYIGFAGRLSPEKGIDSLLQAAAQVETPIALAGSGPMDDEVAANASSNVILRGRLDGDQMNDFYRNARSLVLPSTCFEMCPLVILEAMSHGLPVIASRIGGLGELVDDGLTGLLFEPGNASDLASKCDLLWRDPQLCRKMGLAGRDKATRVYSTDAYLTRLTGLYREAAEICGTSIDDRATNVETDRNTLEAIQ